MLLALIALGGLGVAAGNWRRLHPDLTERIEGFDGTSTIEPTIQRSPDAAPDDTARPKPPADAAATAARAIRAVTPRSSVESPPEDLRSSKIGPADGPLDVNRATARDLERLPGIGAALAERIVATRERDGRFESVEDLQRVPGLGRVRLDRLREFIAVTD
jgi:competence protein ComEA